MANNRNIVVYASTNTILKSLSNKEKNWA